MGQKVILTKGLPGSGKSTWAKALLDREPGKWKRINKDDLRAMLDNSKWSKQNEKFIVEQRDFLITTALINDYSVIVDDTNFHPSHEEAVRKIVEMHNSMDRHHLCATPSEEVKFEIKDFTDVPLEVCIERDKKRPNPVGKGVIMKMWRENLRFTPPRILYRDDLTDIVMVDIDGTVALFGDKNPYSRDFENDEINEPVMKAVHALQTEGAEIVFVSGRKDIYKDVTKSWLEKYFTNFQLHMRKTQPEGVDEPKDTIVKQGIYDTYIKDKYNVIAVFDDRPQVCRVWYKLGLPLFKVGDPDAEF